MKKLKLLWFSLVPLGWFLSFRLIEWVQFYPINCNPDIPNSAEGLCIFLGMSAVFGTFLIMISSIALAIHLQD